MRPPLKSTILSLIGIMGSLLSLAQVVGQYTGIDHATNYTNPQQGATCDNIAAINIALGDADFENGTAEIPLGWQFSGTWASGSSYIDGPGPELLLVSLHTYDEAWYVGLMLEDNTTTAFQTFHLTIVTSNGIGSLTHCGGVVPDFDYERPSQELDFADFNIPQGVGVTGIVFEPFSDGAVDPDPHGVLVLEGTMTCDTSITMVADICHGDSILFEGVFYDTSGTFTHTYENSAGCDSTQVLELTVHFAEDTNLNLSACNGDSVLINGSFETEAGSYINELESAFGCDSVITTELTLNPTYHFEFEEEICEGDSFDVGGTFYHTSGAYPQLLLTNKNCDSTLTTYLNVIQPEDATITETDTLCADGDLIILEAASGGGQWTGPGIVNPSTGEYDPNIAGQGNHEVQYAIDNTCPSSDTTIVIVEPACTLIVPSAFSPNGDNFNNFLVFENLNHYPDNHLFIYNRWGNLIYETQGYQNRWDGGNHRSGTYFYILHLNDTDLNIHKGTITLIR